MLKIFLIIMIFYVVGYSQSLTHPHIWVKNSDKAVILQKINNEDWARNLFEQYKQRVSTKVESHKTDPSAILKEIPPMPTTSQARKKHNEILTLGYECALLYWLTDNDDYGQLAADILNYYVNKISTISGVVHFHEGPSYAFLIDSRELYTKIPIIYDFVYSYLKKNNTKVYDLETGNKIPFSFSKAQKTFRKLADGVFNEGSINSNHPVLEAPGALFNLLSIENDSIISLYMNKFLNGTPKQNGLYWMINECKKSTLWPEATGYSIGPFRIVLELINIVDMYNPSLNIIEKNKDLLKNAFIYENWRYPDGKSAIRFGDAHRYSLNTIDLMHRVLTISKRKGYNLIAKDAEEMLKSLYKRKGEYSPKVVTQILEWNNPYYLLWGYNIDISSAKPIKYFSSFKIDYAGLAVLKNIKTDNIKEFGLMGYIGGGHYVHSHLTGIDLEIYGKQTVVGTGGGDVGAANREDDIFKNYYRIYAGHNSVVINGKSKGLGIGAWKADNQLFQNSCKITAMEPLSFETPLSKNFSFTCVNLDDKVNNAKQQRVLAIVRLNNEIGYYFDMFRSKSNSTNNFHDYIYHNIGDSAKIIDNNGDKILLTSKPNRYKSTPIAYNGSTINFPGWHYFENVKSSSKTSKTVHAIFPITKETEKQYMHMWMPGGENREYTTCKGPATLEAPLGYENKKTPIVSVRHYGEAWSKPFISIFEPSRNTASSIISVKNLYYNNKIIGAKVVTKISNKNITDYIIANDNSDTQITLSSPSISFKGRFAIVREYGDSTILYVGDGSSLKYKDKVFTVNNRKGYKVIKNQLIAPKVTFITPSHDTTINKGSHLYINVNAFGDSINNVELFINGKFLRKEINAPYEWGYVEGTNHLDELDTLSVGRHIIKVVANDVNGLKGEAEIVLNISNEHTNIKLKEHNINLLTIFPNPVNNTIYLNTKLKGDILIYNINGKQLMKFQSSKNKRVDVSKLNSGIYYVVFKNSKKIVAIKSFYIDK